MAPALLALVLSPAVAGTVVVFDGMSREAAREQAATDAAAPADGTTVATLPELLGARPPSLVGPGEIVPCKGLPADDAEVARRLAAALKAVNYLDYPAARRALDEVDASLACLSTPLDGAQAARSAWLRGIVAVEEGDDATARAAFAQSHVYAPGAGWDNAFPPTGRPEWEAAAADVAALPPVKLSVLPAGGGVEVRVDGRVPLDPAAVPVVPGMHLVQVGARGYASTVMVRVDDAVTVVLPGQVREGDAAWVTDPASAASLATVLALVLNAGDDVLVTLPQGTWRGGTDGGWTVVARHTPKWSRRSAPNGVLLAAGGALGVGGGALAVASLVQAGAARNEADAAPTWEAWTRANHDYEQAKTRLLIGEGVAALGVVAFGVGLGVPLGAPPRPTVSLWTTPTGGPR